MTSPRALTQNASSGKQVRRAGQREKRVARDRMLDAKAVMATPEGRRFVWWLLGECNTFASVMRDGSDRAQFNAGKQDIGHMLQTHIITTDTDAYLLMQKEAFDAQKIERITTPEEEPGMVSERPDSTTDDGGDDE